MAGETVVLTTGGTGGHIFPAQALAAELTKRGYKVKFAVDERYQHFGVIDDETAFLIPCAPMKEGFWGRLSSIWTILNGIFAASALLSKSGADIVVGFGGYISFPTCVAASMLSKKLLLHEQNAVIGKANKKLLSRARIIATSFKKTLDIPELYEDKIVFTGNPVRETIRMAADIEYLGYNGEGRLNILVIGGSQGAGIFGSIVPEALKDLPAEYKEKIFITQQCRSIDAESVQEKFQSASIACEVAPFFRDIQDKYARAHLVISRSGASTIAELVTVARPAILVPMKRATENHQYYNARMIEIISGGWIMQEGDFSADALREKIKSIIDKPEILMECHNNLRNAYTNSTKNLADLVVKHINEKS